MIGHQCANHPHETEPQPSTYVPRPIDSNSIYNKLRSQGSTTSLQQLKQFESLLHENTQLRLKVTRMQQKLQQAEDISNRLYHQIQERDSQVPNTTQYHLRNELSNAEMQIAFLEQEVNKFRKQQEHHANTVVRDYEDKNEQILDLKRKLCDLLDIKRRLEEQLDTYEFELGSLRSQYQVEIREKRLRTEALERAIEQHNNTHRKELSMVEEKLREKDKLIRQISIEIEALRHQKLESEKQCYQMKKKYEALEEEIKKKQQDNISRRMSPRYDDDLMREFYSGSRSPIKEYLSTPSTSVNSPKNYGIGSLANKDLGKPYEKIYERVSVPQAASQKSIPVPANPLSSNPYTPAISTSEASRQLVEHMFNNFSRIVQKANDEKCNALVLFSQEMPSFLRSLRPMAENYFRMYLTDPIQPIKISDISIEQGLELTMKVNQWMIDTLTFTKKKYQDEKHDPGRQQLFLFRLLTIRYRVAYPQKGEAQPIQKDIQSLMDRQLLESMLRLSAIRR